MKEITFEKALFSSADYFIVRSAIERLPGLLSAVIQQRFWMRKSIAEISEEFGVSAGVIEAALLKAFSLLRDECVRHPNFSRSKYSIIKSLRASLAA